MSTTAASTSSTTTSTTKFSPHVYLQGLGWTPGQALTSAPHARVKPITVVHKKTLSGLGKDRDTSYNWWEAVFEGLAGKVKESHDKTSTGLISHLPPRAKKSKLDESLDSIDRTNSNGFNMDALGKAKMEMARRQLYASFLRGKVIGSTLFENEIKEASSSGGETSSLDEKKRRRKKEKHSQSSPEEDEESSVVEQKKTKRRRKSTEDGLEEEFVGELKNESKKKSKKSRTGSAEKVSTGEASGVDLNEAQEIARMAEKAERRLQKRLAKEKRVLKCIRLG